MSYERGNYERNDRYSSDRGYSGERDRGYESRGGDRYEQPRYDRGYERPAERSYGGYNDRAPERSYGGYEQRPERSYGGDRGYSGGRGYSDRGYSERPYGGGYGGRGFSRPRGRGYGRGRGGAPYERRRKSPADPATATVLFVGNLPYSWTNENVKDLLAEYELVSVYIPEDRYRGHGKGFAFVEFTSNDDCVKAKDELAMKDVEGRTLRIDFDKKREERPREEIRDRRNSVDGEVEEAVADE